MLNYRLEDKKSIRNKIDELSTDICHNMFKLGLDVDDWNKIYHHFDNIKKIIKKEVEHVEEKNNGKNR